MHYVLIKGQQRRTDVSTRLALATFVSEATIKQLPSWYFSHQRSQYLGYINPEPTPCVPIWHYINYVKGCRFCEIWAVDGVISSDKNLITYFKEKYCGIVNPSDLAMIEAYVRVRIKINAIGSVRGKLARSLSYIDSDELSLLNNHLDSREAVLRTSIADTPTSMLRRNF